MAAVEILLDGAVAERLEGAPWKGTIDFGPDLAPHELVARALDAQGREVARTRQWVNLPRPAAEVEIALEGSGDNTAPAAARVTWQRLNLESPSEVKLLFDGQPLALDATGRAVLPRYDPGSSHVLTAELRFPSDVTARKDIVFGGEYGETHTELTAVPLRLGRGRNLPPVRELEGWFQGPGGPLAVHAVEKGQAELYVVRVPESHQVRERIGPTADRRRITAVPERQQIGQQAVPMRGGYRDDFALRFSDETRMRFVSPWAQVYQGSGVRSELFDIAPGASGVEGLYPYLTRGYFRTSGNEVLRFADAAATAGLSAMAGEHRRAVLVLLDERSVDASRYDALAVRRYLASIRVPLFVWSLDGPPASPEVAAWGKVEDVSSSRKLERAFSELRADLERQRIVWVEGQHLPGAIALGAAAREAVEITGLEQAPAPGETVSLPPRVSFLTPFPELVKGIQAIDLSTRGPVAAVEIRLDGASQGILQGPLWSGRVDLGREPLPRELAAVALDAEGRELARAVRWVNQPAPRERVEIRPDGPGAVRLLWWGPPYEAPERIALALDGAPLSLEKDGRAVLPPHDPGVPHVLTAEVRFSSGSVRRAFIFGGEHGAQLAELTPVPVRLRPGAELPPLDRLQGWLTADGQPLRVAAAEKGPGELRIVRAPGAEEMWEKFLVKATGGLNPSQATQPMALGGQDVLRIVYPRAIIKTGSGVGPQTFTVSREHGAASGGLYWILQDAKLERQHREVPGEQRPADAMAAAALHLSAQGRRRAVLLVLDADATEASLYTAEKVRRLLAAQRVPLFVWTVDELAATPTAAGWGPVAEVGRDLARAAAAYEAVKTELDGQRILWVVGRHLPRSIALTAEGREAAELAGDTPETLPEALTEAMEQP